MDNAPHSRDLRKGRFSEPGRLYLLTTVTKDRAPVFRDFWCGRAVVTTMRYYQDHDWLVSWAFVLMPDHLHWLMELGAVAELPQLMRSFKAHAARRVNQVRGAEGSQLWQAGYHDHAVRKETDIRHLARYVVANPLRSGLVERIGDYPFWDAAWL